MESTDFLKNNQNENDPIRKNLLQAIEKFRLTTDSLHKITGIDSDWFVSYFKREVNLYDLPLEVMPKLSNLSYLLCGDHIISVSNEERNKAIINMLKDEFNMSYETISIYSGLNPNDVENFMANENSISFEEKYKLATMISFLYRLFKSTI